MDKIIVYIDDAAYALGQLRPMLLTERRTQWVLVACTPRLTRHAGKWVPREARVAWRQAWADAVFNMLVPVLQARGDTVERVAAAGADGNLRRTAEQLQSRHGAARILDARRPKFGHHLAPVSTTPNEADSSRWQLPLALASLGAALALVGD